MKQLLDREESAAPASASIGEANARPMTVARARIEKRISKVFVGYVVKFLVGIDV